MTSNFSEGKWIPLAVLGLLQAADGLSTTAAAVGIVRGVRPDSHEQQSAGLVAQITLQAETIITSPETSRLRPSSPPRKPPG
jgi:hypothetical protein